MGASKLGGIKRISGEVVSVKTYTFPEYDGNPEFVELVEHPSVTGIDRPWGYDEATKKVVALASLLTLSPAGDEVTIPPDGTTVVPCVITGPPGGVVDAFDGALKRVPRRPVVRAARAWLARLIDTGRFEAETVAAFGRTRWLNALPGQDFNRLISDLAASGRLPPLAPPLLQLALRLPQRRTLRPPAGSHSLETAS